jgi:hypothetical protein
MLEYFLVFSCNGIDVIFYIYVILEEYKEMLQYSSFINTVCVFRFTVSYPLLPIFFFWIFTWNSFRSLEKYFFYVWFLC